MLTLQTTTKSFMKNRSIIVSLVLLALVIGVYFLLKKDKVSTLDQQETNFAVKEIEKIDKIYLRSRIQNTAALLEKNEAGVWYINGKYPADMAKVNILLIAIKDIKVKFPVGKDYWNGVIKNLSSQGVKVELYSGNKNLRTYYVGGPTPDNTGTYYYMENAKKPYVNHIEGFHGYMSPRFFVNENDWRSKIFCALPSEEIARIEVTWPQDPNASFVIDNTAGKPLLESKLTNKKPINDNKLRAYLNHFDRLAYEGFPLNMNNKNIDSIYKSPVIFNLKVVPVSGGPINVQLHYKELSHDTYQQLDMDGVQMPFDIDRFYAFLNNNNKELLLIQDFVFGKVMKKAGDFLMD